MKKYKQLRKIHITKDDVWIWRNYYGGGFIIYNKYKNNQAIKTFSLLGAIPSEVKKTILKLFY